MRKIYLKTPKCEELWYRKQILADQETMAFNNPNGGTIDFDESKWDNWYMKWIGNGNNSFYYAYVYDKELDIPVGEVAYRLDEESGCAMINIIMESKYRGQGYGSLGLKALVETAFKNGYKELRDSINKDSINSHILFEKIGFKNFRETDGCLDYRMSIDDYKNKYDN